MDLPPPRGSRRTFRRSCFQPESSRTGIRLPLSYQPIASGREIGAGAGTPSRTIEGSPGLSWSGRALQPALRVMLALRPAKREDRYWAAFCLVGTGTGGPPDVHRRRLPREERRVPAHPERHPGLREAQLRRVSPVPRPWDRTASTPSRACRQGSRQAWKGRESRSAGVSPQGGVG